MLKRIFKNIFRVSMAALLTAYVLIAGILYHYFEIRIQEELKSEAVSIAVGVEKSGAEYLRALDGQGGESNTSALLGPEDKRITWIDERGTVLYDSDADEREMENHLERKEIAEAKKNGEGYDVRYSKTLGERTLYYAVALKDGSILRVCDDYSTLLSIFLAMLQPTSILILFVVLLSYLMSRHMAANIVAPINAIDFNSGEMKEEYEELVPLLKRIRKQNRLIDKQMDDLKSQQAKFAALTEHMREGFLVLDKKGDILSYNTAAVELLGASKDMDYIDRNIIHFDRNRNLREIIGEALKGSRCQQTFASGERIFQIFANPIVIEDVVKDETAERTAPQADKVEEDEVVGAVIIILDDTEKEKREQLRREFTSNVSHELKTPLTSISGVAEIMMNGIVKPEDVTGFAQNIYEEAGRLITLIDDIIFLSRLDEGSTEKTIENVSIKDIANQVKERLRVPAKEKEVSIHIVGEEGFVQGVPTMLEEMLYNLCDNGIKYNEEGGRVTVFIENFYDNGVPKVSVAVEDTGIGIPLKEQERIYERFYRVDKSHSKAVGGTGLGLSIVKHIVQFHHGEIQTESMPGKGTTIRVIFSVKYSENQQTEKRK